MGSSNDLRPQIDTIKTAAELKRWYWLKTELVDHARLLSLRSTGAKFDILDRIGHFIDTGKEQINAAAKTPIKSKFDWHSAPLSLETIITDSYKNSQNVRRFFIENIGPDFKFTIGFMDWIKANNGKTLRDAIEERHCQKIQEAQSGYKTRIKPHNQFNQYTRDILAANPQMKMTTVRKIWAEKRSLPTKDGRHVYEVADLDLIKKDP